VDLDSELDRLYSLPHEEFTSYRNALAKSATAAGDGEAAALVKGLKKPSVGAWALNQVTRVHHDRIRDLLSIRDELERAGSPEQLRELSRRRRDLVAELTRFARSILEGSGHGATSATLEKVTQGLLAGGTAEERDLLDKGRLTREPSASGLETLGFDAAPDEDAAPGISLKVRREIENLRRDAERLQQEAARLEREAAFAEEQARRARTRAESAAAAADEARDRAEIAAEEAGPS